MISRHGGASGWVRELSRPAEGRLLAGVCAGFARGLELDVTLVRLAAVLLLFAYGLGAVVYLALWLLIPAENSSLPRRSTLGQILEENLHGIRAELQGAWHYMGQVWHQRQREERLPRPFGRRWVAFFLMAVGAGIFLYSAGLFSWLGPARSFGLAVVALGASILWTNFTRAGDRDD